MAPPRKRTRRRPHHAPCREAIPTRHDHRDLLRISKHLQQCRRLFPRHSFSARLMGISLLYQAQWCFLRLAQFCHPGQLAKSFSLRMGTCPTKRVHTRLLVSNNQGTQRDTALRLELCRFGLNSWRMRDSSLGHPSRGYNTTKYRVKLQLRKLPAWPSVHTTYLQSECKPGVYCACLFHRWASVVDFPCYGIVKQQ